MLGAGGSALDAAIAMQAVLGLVEPQSSGIVGGAFLVHWDGRQVQAFDGRETAPAAATPALFLKPDGQPLPMREA
ncbi:gamma-glutamyltransferase, partial [Klebsiella pneumoniae]